MEIKLTELERLFEEIKEIINYIEMSRYKDRVHRIYLSNGDKLNYKVPNESIAHLLGINTTYLYSTGRYKNSNSFDLLKEMSTDFYKIYKMNNEGIISYDNLFSKYIYEKIKSFKENIKINVDETLLVCKYDSSRAYLHNELAEKYDYIIVKKYENEKIGILCIKEKNNEYVPMSNQIFNSFEEAKETLKKYLMNQEVALMTADNVFNNFDDYEKKYYIRLDNKLKKLRELRRYKEIFKFCLDLSGDYEYSVGKLKENRNNFFEDKDLIDVIVEAIKNGNLIDTEIFRDTNLSKVIEAFNDHICSTQISQNSLVKESYSQMKNNLESFKTQLLQAQDEIETLTVENNQLKESNKILSAENKSNKENLNKIYEIAKKTRM